MNARPHPTAGIADIIDVVAAHFDVSALDLKSHRRNAALVFARHCGLWLSVRLTAQTLPMIGRSWGGRDQTTVLYAVRKINEQRHVDADLAETLVALELAAQGVAQARQGSAAAQAMPQAAPFAEPISPLDVARRVIAALGDHGQPAIMRAVTRVSTMQIVDICVELVRLHERGEKLDLALAPAPEPPQESRQDEPRQDEAPPAPILLDAPLSLPLPPAAESAVHDFMCAEAVYRNMPRFALRVARDDALTVLRAFSAARAPAIAAVVAAYDAMIRAEHTAAERDATERYRAAVRRLAAHYAESVSNDQSKERAREEA